MSLLSSSCKEVERSSSISEVEELSISSCPEHSKLLDDDDIISNPEETKSESVSAAFSQWSLQLFRLSFF